MARSLVAAYPSQVNWRDALLVYRDVAAAGDAELRLDIGRLMRASGALAGERDYLEAAQVLTTTSPGEAKIFLDEGVSRQMLVQQIGVNLSGDDALAGEFSQASSP